MVIAEVYDLMALRIQRIELVRIKVLIMTFIQVTMMQLILLDQPASGEAICLSCFLYLLTEFLPLLSSPKVPLKT